MHERSLVRALIRQVEGIASNHVQSRVLSVRVRLGEFSGVEPELLATAFDDVVQDTSLQGAALDMERVPLEAVCEECGREFRIERFKFRCGECGSVRLHIRGGEELWLESVMFEEIE